MATSVKISNLPPGNFIQSQDEFPVSRSGETYRIAASQIVTEGENIATAPGQGFIYGGIRAVGSRRLLYRPLSGIDGIGVATIGNTVVISASGQNPVMSNFIGNGSTVTFALNEPRSINPNNYRVDIDGVLQKPQEDYNIVGTNLVFTPQSIPPQNTRITVVSNNLVNVYDMIPSDGTVTTNKIFNNAVNTVKIADNAITTPKLSAQAVTNAKLAFDGGAFGFRNKIINGDMRIDQRYNGTLQTWNRPATFFIIDRFRFGGSDGINTRGNWSTQQVTDAPSGFIFSTRIQNTAIATLINDGGAKSFCQNIEGNNIINFQWGTPNAKTATVSFWIKSSIPGTYVLSLGNSRGDLGTGRAYVTTYTINSPNTWEFKTITIPGPTNGIFAELNNLNSSGIRLDWYLGMSTDAASIASPSDINIWTAQTGTPVIFRYNVLGSVNLWLNLNSVWQIAGVQFEEGPTATPFEHRPIGTELALCQRYYEKLSGRVQSNGPTTGSVSWHFKVTKRTNPNVTNTIAGYSVIAGGLGVDVYTVAGSNSGVVGDGSTAEAEL
jgi:hypothetical protein